jgi:hypothetical protein
MPRRGRASSYPGRTLLEALGNLDLVRRGALPRVLDFFRLTLERIAAWGTLLTSQWELSAGGGRFGPPTEFLPDAAQPGGHNLYRRIFHVDFANLYFAGLVEAHRALLPIAEAQAGWVAAVLDGGVRLPPDEERRARGAAEGKRARSDFGDRRLFIVDWAKYKARLRRDQGSASKA